MSNENVLLTQGGYFVPSFPIQPPMAPVNYHPTHIQPNALNFAPSPPANEPFTYVSLDDLKALLPPDQQDEKIETGLLPDGRAYAPRSARRDRYCLFTGKIPYILYFTQYYFSRENIDRDGIFRGLMDDNYSIPLEQVIKAPRLASVNTTTEELKTAIETGSDLLVIVSSPDGISSLKRKDNYPGPSSGASSLLQADSTRASFDSRAGNSERPTPSASVNPEIDPSFPPLQQYSVFRFHSPNNLDPSSMIYQPQTPFYQTQARPPSVTAPAINPNAAAITQLTSIMSGMNLGQPGQPTPQAAAAGNPHHPTAQQAPQFFNPMSNFAAAIAAFNARTSNFQFTAPFPPNLFPPNPAGQSRPGTAPAANIPHQQFFNPHQQQAAAAAQRRVSPPPPHATTVTAQQQTPANVSANVLNLQLPGAATPLYNMHNPHDAHFAPGFPPAQSFDSAWLTEGAALMNGGSFPHLGYTTPSVMSGAPIMAWPPNQPPPPQIRSTQHHHPIPQASNYQLYNVPPANLLPTQVTTTTTQSATVSTTSSSENVKNVSTTTNSNAAVPTTSVPSSSASSSIGGKDESTTTSTTPAAVNEGVASAPAKKHSLTANHQSSGSAAQQHSRPNSSGSNKGNKYNNSKSATGKCGGGGVQHHHHHQRGHSNRAPGNSMGPVSSTATASTSTTAAVTSNSNAVASSPPAK
ncbi:unnamed protein product [Hymenolepis diminuta]|uniref:Uncharacterized protein n=1 Tax=Hymenolepis diminuta TaxID=6216 RepID=A0A564YCC1_HYMDI|nr:unnamed protein product [Hymenolepis diminuta]